ncbi:MAG TPA: hypothetical protein VF789_07030 [Thermoanaerobaculia bacterium]
MSRSIVHSLLAVALLTAGAAQAGTVYVPTPGVSTVGSANYETQVVISNTAAQPREVRHFQIANDADGTQRGGSQSTPVQVQGGRSSVVKPPAAARGLLELSGPAELRYAARLTSPGQGARLGAPLPVITSDNLGKANQSLSLQGLLSGNGRATDVALINLGHQASVCTVGLFRADGSALTAAVTVNLKPLSQVYFANALGNAGAVTEIRAAVGCTRDFYAYALLTDAATGEISTVFPAGSGESLLTIPGAGAVCPTGAQCFDAKGLFHKPSKTDPYKRMSFAPAPGTYKKIRMTMDVLHGGWNPANPGAQHELFWMVKNRNFDMFGYATFRGPGNPSNANTSLLRHGIGLTHPQKIKIIKPFTATPGTLYNLEYIYDTTTNVLELVTRVNGEIVNRISGSPNVTSFSFTADDRLIVDVGFDGTNSDEQPTLNWEYRDLHLELTK